MNFIVTAKRTEAHCKQKYISFIMQVSVKEKTSRVLLKKFLTGSLKVGWGPRSVFGFFLLYFRLLLTLLLSAQYVKIMWRNPTHINNTRGQLDSTFQQNSLHSPVSYCCLAFKRRDRNVRGPQTRSGCAFLQTCSQKSKYCQNCIHLLTQCTSLKRGSYF